MLELLEYGLIIVGLVTLLIVGIGLSLVAVIYFLDRID